MTTQTSLKTSTAWAIDPAHSHIEFSAKHMVISKVKGRFGKFEVDVQFDEDRPELSRVVTRIDASSLSTNNDMRDDHLRSSDFLDVANYPHVTFESKRVERLVTDRYSIVGNLTIRGVTREVTLDTEFSGIGKDPWGSYHAGFSAATSIDRKDFGLTWNSALETGGVLVGDQVKITIDLELIRPVDGGA